MRREANPGVFIGFALKWEKVVPAGQVPSELSEKPKTPMERIPSAQPPPACLGKLTALDGGDMSG